jgi:uncharacterized protein (DUF58 family)
MDVREAIPLHPRRRLIGTAPGGWASVRRGGRADIASSRPYRPGDPIRTIDWKTSARLSSARNEETFIVRERFADEMPAVVLVVDRRPAMALYPPELPWLSKPRAILAVSRILVASAVAQRSLVGYLDVASRGGEFSHGAAFWEPPRAQRDSWGNDLEGRLAVHDDRPFDAAEDNVEQALSFLSTMRRHVPIGSFVFVLSDFIAPVRAEAWADAVDHGWDVVPVVIQDPIWEQSFPRIDGIRVLLADATLSQPHYVRLSEEDVEERRRRNEQRLTDLRSELSRLGLDTIVISDASSAAVQAALLDWSHARLAVRARP